MTRGVRLHAVNCQPSVSLRNATFQPRPLEQSTDSTSCLRTLTVRMNSIRCDYPYGNCIIHPIPYTGRNTVPHRRCLTSKGSLNF